MSLSQKNQQQPCRGLCSRGFLWERKIYSANSIQAEIFLSYRESAQGRHMIMGSTFLTPKIGLMHSYGTTFNANFCCIFLQVITCTGMIRENLVWRHHFPWKQKTVSTSVMGLQACKCSSVPWSCGSHAYCAVWCVWCVYVRDVCACVACVLCCGLRSWRCMCILQKRVCTYTYKYTHACTQASMYTHIPIHMHSCHSWYLYIHTQNSSQLYTCIHTYVFTYRGFRRGLRFLRLHVWHTRNKQAHTYHGYADMRGWRDTPGL